MLPFSFQIRRRQIPSIFLARDHRTPPRPPRTHCPALSWECLSQASESASLTDQCPVCRKPQLLDPNNYRVDGILADFLVRHFGTTQVGPPLITHTRYF